jgi:TonB family protein
MVFFQGSRRILVVSVLSVAAIASALTGVGRAEDDGARKVQNKVQPAYPDLARRMKIVGAVKVQVTVAPNGSVKDVRVVGGHPVLANAVVDAVRRWHFETRPQTTTENLEFRFDPSE